MDQMVSPQAHTPPVALVLMFAIALVIASALWLIYWYQIGQYKKYPERVRRVNNISKVRRRYLAALAKLSARHERGDISDKEVVTALSSLLRGFVDELSERTSFSKMTLRELRGHAPPMVVDRIAHWYDIEFTPDNTYEIDAAAALTQVHEVVSTWR